jgi:replicative superfamily II helicase
MHSEKLYSLPVGNSKFINDIGLVLMEEFQCLTDEKRRQVLKLLLTRILPKQKQPQIVGLAAVVGKSEDAVKSNASSIHSKIEN